MAQQLKRTAKRSGSSPASAVPTEQEVAASTASRSQTFFKVPTNEVNGEGLSIPVSDISANPFNDRDLGDLTGLADSIKMDGLLQDIVVMHTAAFVSHYPDFAETIGTKYVIAMGERRWSATQVAGIGTIQAVLRNDIAPNIRRVLFVENFHRKDLSPMEEARKFQRMHNEEGMTYREIAEDLSLSGPSYVSRRLELMVLPAQLQELIGAEDGLGVTDARKIAAALKDPEEQIHAWHLVCDEGLSLKQAIQQIRSGDTVPPGNNVPEPRRVDPAEVVDPAKGGMPEPTKQQTTLSPASAGSETNADPEAADPSAQPSAPAVQPSKAVAAADRHSAARNHASADREQTCLAMIKAGVELTAQQADALFARTLLAPTQQGPARTRAHKWLRDGGKAGFSISDTDSYFEAVLSSGNAELIKTVTIATALAAGEIRARDGRRPWDQHDAEHVRLLIEVGQHHPESSWEAAQLTKHGIPFPTTAPTTQL
ncbi:ParB/RepB/Spo0J family partition protein [Streptomyces sp. NPDC097619]|uniref:ParB/RepB/Spo0J family partition protein n=1 Tax=Streptomyces sp. NPDC097619 TaxID=3157228 RepID=UPI0033164DDB